jgi:hypothetical protein
LVMELEEEDEVEEIPLNGTFFVKILRGMSG